MAAKKIGAIIALDGEKEFRQAVINCNKSLTQFKSEMRLVAAESDGQANSLESLQKKHTVLGKILDEQKSKEEAVRAGLEHAQKSYQGVSTKLDEYKRDLESAKGKLDEMRASTDTSSKEMEEQELVVKNLSTAVEKGEQIYQKAGNRVKDWETKLNTAQAQVIKANTEVNKNAAYMREAEESTNKCATSIDAFGKKVEKSTELTVNYGDVIKANLINAATNFAKSVVGEAIAGVTDLENAQNQLQASTGASARVMQEYGSVLEDVYKNNYGESFDDVADATGIIVQNLGELDPSALQDTAESAITLRDTFGMDYQEQLRAVKSLMDNFGISADDAYNLIAQGAQEGLNKNGDLLDTINEYSVHYSKMGISAEGFFNSLANGTDAGTFSVDKLGDAYKEFGIRVKDTATTTTEGYQLLGLNADRMRVKFAAGGESAKKATDEVLKALYGMDDQVKQNQAGVDLFGTMWEDLGKEGVQALMDVNGQISTTKDVMSQIKEIKYDSLTNKYEQLGRTAQKEIIAPLLKEFLPVAEEGIVFLTENMDKMLPVVSGIGAGFAAWKVAETVGDAVKWVKSFSTVTEKAAEAQKVLNLTTNANIYTAVATAAAGAAVAMAAYVSNMGEVSKEAQKLSEVNERVTDSANEVTDATQETIAAYGDNTSEIQAQSAYAKTLAEEIENLASKENLSNSEKQVMQEYISELNGLVPDLNLAYDEQTKTLSQTNEEIEKHIDLNQKDIEAQAAQEYAIELIKQKTKLEIEQIKLKDQKNELSGKEMEYLDEEGRLLGENRKSYKEITEAQAENSEALEGNQDALDEVNSEVESLKENQKKLGLSWSDATEKANTNTDANNANAESAANNASAQQTAAENMQAAAQGIADTYTGMQETVAGVLESQMNMFEEFNGGVEITSEVLLGNMQSQIEGVTNWAKNMSVLADRGVNQGILEKLAEMGPQGASYVQAFAQMSNDQLQEANAMWAQSLDMKEGVNTSVQGMIEQYTVALNGGKEQVNAAMQGLGYDTVQGLVQGVNANVQQAADAGSAVGTSVTTGAKASLDSNSPSKVFIGIGQDVVSGLVLGVSTSQGNAVTAVTMLSQGIVSNAQSVLNSTNFSVYGTNITMGIANGIASGEGFLISKVQSTMQSIKQKISSELDQNKYHTDGKNVAIGVAYGIESGRSDVRIATSGLADAVDDGAWNLGEYTLYSEGLNVSYGLANGIYDGRSSVINAVESVCRAAIREAKAELGIASPSKVFAEIGGYTAEGFGVGYEREIKEVNKMIQSSIETPETGEIHFQGNGMKESGNIVGLLSEYLPYLQDIVNKQIYIYPSRREFQREIMETTNSGMMKASSRERMR